MFLFKTSLKLLNGIAKSVNIHDIDIAIGN